MPQAKARRANHLAVLALVALPSLATAALAVRLVDREITSHRHRETAERGRAVLAEARILSEATLASLDSIREQAIELLDRPLAVLNASIIHCAEIEVDHGGPGGAERLARVRQAQRFSGPVEPATLLPGVSFFDTYLAGAIERIDLAEVRRNGVAMIRVKRDPQHREEWLAFAFPKPQSSNIALALIDPFEAFPLFRRWSEHGTGAGSLDRGYIIANDGYIVTHSDRAFWGTDFSGTELFHDGIAPLFDGRRGPAPTGTFAAIDQNTAATAMLRLGALPLAVVVEHVLPPQPLSSLSAWVPRDWEGVISPLFAMLLAAALLTALAAALVARRFAEIELRTGDLAPESPELETETSLEELPPLPLAEAAPAENSEAKPEIRPAVRRAERPTPPSALPAGAAASGVVAAAVAAPTEPAPEPPGDVLAAIEALQNSRDTRMADASIQMRHRDEVVLSKFEAEATGSKDVRQTAARLSQACSRVFDAPTLFFGYHSGVHAAILYAHAGFTGGPQNEPAGMSFPIQEAVLERVFEIETRGSIAALTEFLPLQRVMSTHFPNRRFQAWAVTGFAPSIKEMGGPRLIGVIVMLESSRSLGLWHRPEQQGALVRLFRATGLSYENALLSQ